MIWRIPVRDLKLIVDLLRDILLQVCIDFDTQEIKFCSVDPEKVASVEMCLNPSMQEYKCILPISFSFYLQSLFKVLRGADKKEVAVLSCFADDPDRMTVRITGNDAQCFVIWRIKEPRPDYRALPFKQAYSWKMDGNDFYTMIRDLSAIGKILEVSVLPAKDQLVFGTRDALGTTAEYVMEQPLEKSVSQVMGTDAQRYIFKYIEKFAKPGLTEKIWISVGPRSPIRFVWNMDYGYLALNVAPLPERANP